MRKFHLEIVTPDGSVWDGDAEAILVRTNSGDVEIMANHADYIASLGIGRAKLTADGKASEASLAGGFISVVKGEVKLVATTFEFAEDIDLERAESARDRAERAIKTAADDKALAVAKAKLARALCRINVAKNR